MFLRGLVALLPWFGKFTAAQGLFGFLVPTLSTSAGPDPPQVSTSSAGTQHPPEPIPKAASWKQLGYTEAGRDVNSIDHPVLFPAPFSASFLRWSVNISKLVRAFPVR